MPCKKLLDCILKQNNETYSMYYKIELLVLLTCLHVCSLHTQTSLPILC